MPVLPRPDTGRGTELDDVVARVPGAVREAVGGPAGPRVTGVSIATARTAPGDLFVAVPGRRSHGAAHAAAAVAAGAVAVLTDVVGAELLAEDGRAPVRTLPVVVVPDVRAAAGPVAAAVYGDPASRLRVVGITGTSGKTTTSFLVRAGLAAAGRRTGLIGTVTTDIAGTPVATGFTTPEAPDLQALLAVMADRQVTDVVMEVSSQGLELGRVGGARFAAAGFTNLSQDHLDFHPDLEAYYAAKASLFTGGHGTTLAGPAVVVVDDEAGRRLVREVRAAGGDVETVATTTDEADWWASDVETDADGTTRFRLHTPDGRTVPAGCAVPGGFNVANVALAVALLAAVGVDAAAAATAVRDAVVPGRMERVSRDGEPLGVVDYSHKPDAVARALAALRPMTPGRLTIVLGAGGDRDRSKRPLMGEAAARGADLLVVTDDNPRSEDPAAIRAAVLAGAVRAGGVVGAGGAAVRAEVVEIGSRAQAIALAVARSAPGDTVLVAGKGHETGQQVGDVVHPFDDRVVLRAALDTWTAP